MFWDRMREPSSWGGFGVILMGLAQFFPEITMVLQGVGAVLGAAGVMAPERGRR